jgi:ABC-2 type transport system ATP-binding protein
MLQISIVNKAYGNKVVLKDAQVSIKEYGIYGFIGKNGEGKTTLFKCIHSLTDFKGTVSYMGSSIRHNEIAYCPTEIVMYDDLTASEFSDFYKELLSIKKSIHNSLFDVPQDKLIKEFSTGMKKKSYLNAILQKKYSIYIFDEPFNGLDLESNYLLMNYIKEIAKDSIVFISSHILEILYKDCDSIFLINNTKIKKFERHQFLEIEEELFLNKTIKNI